MGGGDALGLHADLKGGRIQPGSSSCLYWLQRTRAQSSQVSASIRSPRPSASAASCLLEEGSGEGPAMGDEGVVGGPQRAGEGSAKAWWGTKAREQAKGRRWGTWWGKMA